MLWSKSSNDVDNASFLIPKYCWITINRFTLYCHDFVSFGRPVPGTSMDLYLKSRKGDSFDIAVNISYHICVLCSAFSIWENKRSPG